MESTSVDYGKDIFNLVRNLGPPPTEARDTLFANLTNAERRLVSLTLQHDKLVKEINSCQFTISAIRSLHAPWRRLPPELLAEIFSYCIPAKTTEKPSTRTTPINLTQVCSTWYRIATSLPQLWSSVVLTSDPPYLPDRLAHGTEYFRACALRSRNIPLELHLNIQFIAYRPSYDLIQQHSHNISTISFHYPQPINVPANVNDQTPDGPCTWFIHNDPLILPNLRSLEIQDPNVLDNFSEADFNQLRTIANSAQCLQRYMLHNRLVQPDGPVLANWTNLNELTLIDPTPVALLSHILRNAPLLQYASFNCLYESLAPTINPPMQTMLANPELHVPFTHHSLQTLLVSYGDAITLNSLFNLITLPGLKHMLFEKWSEDLSAWAQESFVSFLKRSKCALKALDLYFTPVTTADLIEILEVPTVNEALRELVIQNGHSEAEQIIDDDSCQLLTLPTLPLTNGEAEEEDLDENVSSRIICPNLEVLGLHSCYSCSFSMLVKMLKSRLNPDFRIGASLTSSSSTGTSSSRTYFKYFEHDIPPDIALQYFKPLLRDGLVTVQYDSDTNMSPLTIMEKKLLRKYIDEGLQLWEYDPVNGAWGPNDSLTKV